MAERKVGLRRCPAERRPRPEDLGLRVRGACRRRLRRRDLQVPRPVRCAQRFHGNRRHHGAERIFRRRRYRDIRLEPHRLAVRRQFRCHDHRIRITALRRQRDRDPVPRVPQRRILFALRRSELRAGFHESCMEIDAHVTFFRRTLYRCTGFLLAGEAQHRRRGDGHCGGCPTRAQPRNGQLLHDSVLPVKTPKTRPVPRHHR